MIIPGGVLSVFELAQQLVAVHALIRHDERAVAHRADALGPEHFVGKLQVQRQLARDLPIAERAAARCRRTTNPCTLASCFSPPSAARACVEEIGRLGVAGRLRDEGWPATAAERRRAM